MRLPNHTYRPKFIHKKDVGEFPPDLLFGFEAEMSIWNIDANGTEKIIKGLIADTEKFYYIKYDGSITGGSTGAEINSHPFNWAYLQNHKVYLEKLSQLKDIRGNGDEKEFFGSKAKQFRINRSCGFHIHISKNYFERDHLNRITSFFYNNKDFIEEISQRKGTYSLDRFSKTSLKGRTVEEFIRDSEMYSDPSYRYRAINICGSDTIEIRIFQGTLNYSCMLAYLEFALAIVIFTEIAKKSKLKPENFIKFIENEGKTYNNFLSLYNKQITWE